ncbi:hypothetical protein A9404_01490 [Halothiobacillus diazotrophicus]|uniref:Uncharacterized protein n=1 Tax=Halothiobacillus diazotrophicus TaxID=1860122 RepID=A0A191ZEC8_9GAMM|nr:hypothetical protein [Halothiobacillus diazotrophicus]ANJ66222.1 hypothetical protein A9404_01490 [Halothiobacillus diazotrophicus]
MSEKPDDTDSVLRWAGLNHEQRQHAADALESMGLGGMSLDNRMDSMQPNLVTIRRHDGKHTLRTHTVLEDHQLLLIGPIGHTGLMLGEDIEISFENTTLIGTVEKIEPTHRSDDEPGSEIVWLRTLPAPLHTVESTVL